MRILTGMAETVYTLTDAARMIGISRPTLYKYLDREEYRPAITANYPTLTKVQIAGIKKERNGKSNGKRKGRGK